MDVIEQCNRLRPQWGFAEKKAYVMHLRIDENDSFVCGLKLKKFISPKFLQPYKVCETCYDFAEKQIGVAPLQKVNTYEHIVQITEGDEPLHSIVMKKYAYAKSTSQNKPSVSKN